ncbi:MAG TPA: amidohydrolase family protein [Vicinamibacterales bacterium]|nr:amidohydrolase family protein [Vicinamibacterales bacterium]
MPMRRVVASLVVLCALSACGRSAPPASPAQSASPAETFDVLITNGRVVDGTGAPWYRADVGIIGDRIAAIGQLGGRDATTRIDASNLVVAPGFIDMLGQSEFNVLADPRAASKITQGITTEITGEGASIAPLNDALVRTAQPTYDRFKVVLDFRTLGEYFARLEKNRPALNMGTFVGSGGVRAYVMGNDQKAATPADLEAMKKLVEQAMQHGALGVSTSLQYVPGRFATTDEIVELAKVAKQYGGIYITHQRSESGQIIPSLDEAFAVAERANIPTEVWHLKTAYKANWGRMPEVLKHFEAARARGLDVTANMYPYDRASNGLDACLPLWVREGGLDQMLARLKDPSLRERIKRDMEDANAKDWENQWYGSGGGAGVMVSTVLDPALRKWEGKNLVEIGKEMGKDPRDAAMDLVIADQGETSVIISIMREDDVRLALANPMISIGTDSGARAEDGPFSESKSHPRAWGSFPRVLGKYVREEKLMTLEDAVRRFTSRPAGRVGLTDRGILRPGMKADVTVFNADTIRDVSTFVDPTHYSQGVEYVLVNGKAVISGGKITNARPGEPIRGPGYRK